MEGFEPRPGCVGTSIVTFSGGYFDFLEPEKGGFAVIDIAEALSKTCRYNGHTNRFYSVAQHCVMVSRIVPPEHALAGLMHDASEAYTGDMVSPLKQIVPQFREIEDRIEAAIAKAFDLPHPWPPSIKHADLVMLKTEKRDLTAGHDHTWPGLEHIEPLTETIFPWSPQVAASEWLHRFRTLTKDAL